MHRNTILFTLQFRKNPQKTMSASVKMSTDEMSREELTRKLEDLQLKQQVADLELAYLNRVSEVEYAKSTKGRNSHRGAPRGRTLHRGGNSHRGAPRGRTLHRGGNSHRGAHPCKDGDRCQEENCPFSHPKWTLPELGNNIHNVVLKILSTVENDRDTGIYDGTWSCTQFGSWLKKSPNARALYRNLQFFKTKKKKKLTDLLSELLNDSDTIILIDVTTDHSKPQWALCLGDGKESAADSDAGTDASARWGDED